MVSHADQDAFEAFYKDVRLPLLLQCWALTDDFGASQRAVRETMVAAWHHWPKVRRLPDKSAWVRPRAMGSAMRRRHVLPFHTEQEWPPEVEKTLAGLAALPVAQRRLLLLSHLTDADITTVAREAGVAPLQAAADLAAAEVVYRETRQMHDIVESLVPLADVVAQERWPRPSILTRAGARRRRLHTAAGAVITVAAVGLTGWLVTDADGVQPRLDSLKLHTPDSEIDGTGVAPYDLAPEALLDADQLGKHTSGRWRVESTAEAAQVIDCQQATNLDPNSRATLTRTFAPAAGTTTGRSASQIVEVSRSQMAAQTTFRRAESWVAGCNQARTQLGGVYDVDGVGNIATVITVTDWRRPQSWVTIGLARTGNLTTAVQVANPLSAADQTPDAKQRARAVDLLAEAVDNLCTLPEAGVCSTKPKATRVPPPAVGAEPGMLNVVDLPPVNDVDKPWVGTEPESATFNAAATRCDEADFTGPKVTESLTQTFVIPEEASLPAQFGLTQTVGGFRNEAAASDFIDSVRAKLNTCPDNDLGADVTRVVNQSGADQDLSVWHVEIEISDKTSVLYLMSMARDGDVVSQVGFVPAGKITMESGAFATLSQRALSRLGYF